MLYGKTAVVTGAGRGIGKAVALKLAAKGANIVVNYVRGGEEAGKLKQEIEARGGKALVIQADISVFSQARDLVAKTKAEFGTVDILVNNAGITHDGLLMRMSEEDFDRVIAVNLKGVFNCSRQVVPLMVKQKAGRIINIASVVGLLGNAGQTNYAAAKAGVIGFTKSLAKEIGSRNITVNAVAPGFIETDMTAALPEKAREALKENIALKRLGKPENVADVVYFLASDMGAYITGQVISVDGGMAF
jgi:3-oxoacyl-[acyl-carrier protein] reductase